MQQVYNVFALGLGDDEDAWELCSTHASPEGAESAKQALLDMFDPEDGQQVEVRPTPLLP